ncbi:hypothetical protein GXM_04440 [Nostoc sphaeroides CCNUC1]|uniref:Uncharacterized protein n=1 Tax=Nostoc sphaeroides CCNUC1 TaxID=2653204 RepID=A0A5P8W4M0_9NOSO|nr:hypothetical protein GXM_04440 [Nostoc sphaeroides CCNUC1]
MFFGKVKRAVKNRVYTGKVHLRGLINQWFSNLRRQVLSV